MPPRALTAALVLVLVSALAVPEGRASSIDGTPIKAAMQRAQPAITRCYARALALDPGLAGHMTVRFTLDARGKVVAATAESKRLPPDMLACVAKAVRRVRFPPRVDPAPVTISYPFAFAPGAPATTREAP